MSGPFSVQVIPARPDFFLINGDDEKPELYIGDAVIGWRISTYLQRDGSTPFSNCDPITINGDAPDNCIGVLNPDRTVTMFNGKTYLSLNDAIMGHASL